MKMIEGFAVEAVEGDRVSITCQACQKHMAMAKKLPASSITMTLVKFVAKHAKGGCDA